MKEKTSSGRSPLLFLHGWGTTSKIWQAQAAHFSPSWPVLIPDYLIQNPAFPYFSPPRTLNSLAEGLFSLCHDRSLPPVHLIGWSLGSLIAMKFISRFPILVASLTLVAGTPKFVADEGFPDGLAKGELRLLRKRLMRDRLIAFSAFHRLLFTDQEKTGPLMLKIRDLLKPNREISDQALVEGMDILEGADLRPVLSAIQAPVLILHGENDQLCSLGAARYLHRHIPYSRLKTFSDCGHLPFLTREEEFNQILENFLQSPKCPSESGYA